MGIITCHGQWYDKAETMTDTHTGVRHKSKNNSQSWQMSCEKLTLNLPRFHFFLEMLLYPWLSRNFGKILFIRLILSSLMENIAECVYNSEKTPKSGGVLIWSWMVKKVWKVNFNLESARQSKRKCGPTSISLKFLPVACRFSFSELCFLLVWSFRWS